MSDSHEEAVAQGKRVLRLLQLHHRQQQDLERARQRLAQEVRDQVDAFLAAQPPGAGEPRAGAAPESPGAEWPALQAAADLARSLPDKLLDAVLAKLPQELAESFLAALYSFHALPALSSREVETVVRAADKRTLAIALLGAPEEHFHAVTNSMSKRAAEMLREDMESLLSSGELRTRDVNEAREELSTVIRTTVRTREDSQQ
ncbi:MAG: FliG C-terminal domain-containing protein [Spirochaetota bacterium]